MTTLRHAALIPLCLTGADDKAKAGLALDLNLPAGADEQIAVETQIPGRPSKPVLVLHTEVKPRSVHTVEGRAALIHAICHIELNAIDLACDIIWRFHGMPDLFYRQWAQVAKEEALHFSLLRDHLRQMGFEYGDFPAHDGLWRMAEKTKHDLLARLALVPRTLEARGLDASPPIKKKLVSAGDMRAGEILDVILRDEIGHVAVGNHWYRYLCEQQGREVVATYAELAEKYDAPKPRGPFNLEARRLAGFDEAELAALGE
ncbi:ferritin-like domain-containing protein [Hydrogenophaga sp. PAMC20947]|uniref:ferritin-like domain-containing protein n=1 Tax=Hydrogenophaga sp. PAMC20947 TaxID=2565558 RepID=UPI00109DC6F6|nr:ferritin-like domain-containing protein [Hydrogenophaga sp. PAMC20947]QCB44840.1 ferritin-like domain-containing protein [Hydrogenophaga sp. PAMC20947]